MGFTGLVRYGPGTAPCRTAETAGLNRLDAGQRFEMQFHTKISYHVPR